MADKTTRQQDNYRIMRLLKAALRLKTMCKVNNKWFEPFEIIFEP